MATVWSANPCYLYGCLCTETIGQLLDVDDQEKICLPLNLEGVDKITYARFPDWNFSAEYVLLNGYTALRAQLNAFRNINN